MRDLKRFGFSKRLINLIRMVFGVHNSMADNDEAVDFRCGAVYSSSVMLRTTSSFLNLPVGLEQAVQNQILFWLEEMGLYHIINQTVYLQSIVTYELITTKVQATDVVHLVSHFLL